MPVKDGKDAPSRKLGAPPSSDVYKDEAPSPFSIEGIRSGAVQSKIFKGFILLSGLVMAGGFIMSAMNPTAPTNQGGRGQAPTNAAVATVGNQTITGVQLARSLDQQERMNAQFGQKTGIIDYMGAKQRALQGLTDNASNIIAAQNAGITVSGADIDAKIADLVKDQLKPQQGQSEAAFRRMVEQQYGTLDKAKEELSKNYDRDAVSNFLLVDKLEKQIKADNKVTDDDYKRSVTKLKLWQIVLHPKFPPPGTKDVTAENAKNALEAQTRATKLASDLKTTPTLANFKATAIKSSEDLATKTKGGDLGWKLPAEVMAGPAVGDALSKTAGSLAGPFKDDAGNQYIFFIETRKTVFPKDYAKNKKKLFTDFESSQDDAAWTKKQDEYKKLQTPSISDNALSAYQLQTVDISTKQGDEQKTARADAIKRYNDALASAGDIGVESAAIQYQLSQLYRDENDRAKQQEALAAAVKADGDDANIHLEYARALREGGKPKDALEQVKAASKALDANPGAPSPFGGYNPSDQVRQQIATEFDTLKEPKLAATERGKIKPPPAGGGMGGLPPGVTMSPAR